MTFQIFIAEPSAFSLTAWLFERLLPPLIAGVAVALLASFLLPRLNDQYRARREYLLSDIDALREQIEALLEVSSSFWTTPKSEEQGEIEFRLRVISALVESCAPDLWRDPNDEGPSLVQRLYLACGTEEFWRSALPAPEPDRLRRIAECASHLSEHIVDSRHRHLKRRHRSGSEKKVRFRS